ncbi:hypothetical protein BDQ12DRAFT_633054 [Crucibulum laeve]|uniref:Uncharacterized protein n=1 Tax=Crucibulum laeve TaxID=68775 RepID=A0A5C3LV02_9AGAR|nr:hypothetical protein BDQ12DRAFT_633054 [Crucibulum laeve]
MDELLHHCLRELAFDGDLGCNISRLKDFIVEFYAHTNAPHPQNLDDAFCSFVWSLVVQQPTVRVGTIPPGVTPEVWIAPQTSAKRKAKARGEEHVETTPPELDLVPNAKKRTLDDLVQEYGDRLRIALDSDAIYAAITGSHIRFAKLSPMVYSALQIITRGRDNGITVVGLGQQSKYDQKTCFYLVRQLTELDLVVKVRRGGVGTHFCIHKYFFERNPSWKAIRDEETQAEDLEKQAQKAELELEEDATYVDSPTLDFSPIDARHLSSLPLIRARVVKLLKASKNYIHASNNMLITLGFSNPTKTDRRFFQSRIREMIQQGTIEKVVVPSNKKKSINASVKCFRLVTSEKNGEEGVVVQNEADDDEKDGGIGDQSSIKMNITIHKQIIDLLEESGTVGMTLNELSSALCQFDKRTIELLLTRADKYPPPSHLRDLGIAGLMETSGRERRHRYYTIAAYRSLVAREQLNKSSAGYGDIDLDNVGGFCPLDRSVFYDDEAILFNYQDVFKDKSKAKSGKGRKNPPKNPILPDGSVKQGRPRKYPLKGEAPSPSKVSRKRNRAREDKVTSAPELAKDFENNEHNEPIAKKRRLYKPSSGDADIGENEVQASSVKKKRGRPTKVPKVETLSDPSKKRDHPPKVKATTEVSVSVAVPKKRGRPRKNPILASDEANDSPTTHKKRGPPPKRRKTPANDGEDAMGLTQEESTSVVQDSPLEDTVEEPSQSIDDGVDETVAPHLDIEPMITPVDVDMPMRTVTETMSDKQSNEHVHRLVAGADYSEAAQDADALDSELVRSSGSVAHSPIPDESQMQLDLPQPGCSTEPPQPNHSQAPDVPSIPVQSNTIELPDVRSLDTTPRTRVNVSHLRRENELYRVLENLGGVVNVQTKEFFDAHMSLIESLAKVGEPTSAPIGTRTDKRTASKTLNNLERHGRIKLVKANVTTHTGVNRQTCIAYLPELGEERLNTFLMDLSRGIQPPPQQLGNFVKIDERVEYGADPTSTSRGALPLQLLQMEQPGDDRKERWSKNLARAEQLFKYDDATIREVLLAERTTLGQMYGFIVGKVVRARELHLSALKAFDASSTSPNIVSKDKRIIDISFFCHDLPLGLYCSLVSSLSHDDRLTHFFSTEEGRQTLVHDLPAHIHSVLQIGRSRARSRFLDILETLRSLKLVTPLQPTESETPWITCEANGDHPIAFQQASMQGWTINTPISAPAYWHFSDIAPIHLWAIAETLPPFWKDVPINTWDEGVIYWNLLRDACTNTQIAPNQNSESSAGNISASISVARSLRRAVSWNPDYVLTWHQMQYLKQFVDISSGHTLLQDEDETTRLAKLEKICWVTSVPEETVVKHLCALRGKLLRELDKARQRVKHQTAEKKAKRVQETKVSLARKAEEALKAREQEWDNLLQRVHPTTLEEPAAVRVSRVRKRFLQAGSTKDVDKWENAVTEALKEADLASKKVLKISSKRVLPAKPLPANASAPPVAAFNPTEPSVQSLIEKQGPAITAYKDKSKRNRNRNRKDGEDDSKKGDVRNTRRHRFQWNRDYDELARDASAIIRARCRGQPRLDWAAFEQVFPAVPRNTVRQRLTHIKDSPGNDAYLTRLEDRWHDLWIKHRGTLLLPDDDPQSTSNFDLIKHVEFLRKHVDKNALRVGFAEPAETTGIIIPRSVGQLVRGFDVIEGAPAVPVFDFMWNATVEEGREKRLQRLPFTQYPRECAHTQCSESETVAVAEAALKMAMGMPPERYDPEAASMLLRSAGDKSVGIATKNLISRGILSKSQRDPTKQKPGRQLKISENNQNAIGGSVSRDIFQDAVALDEIASTEDAWREWPLTATDGDLAALIQLVSDNQVEFKVDTSHPQAARPALDWNSKKADDDQIETVVYVHYTIQPASQPNAPNMLQTSSNTEQPMEMPMSLDLPSEAGPGHGCTLDGGLACCRQLTEEGIVDCMGCLEEEWLSLSSLLNDEERQLARLLLETVQNAGEQGVTKSDLMMNMSDGRICLFLQRMTESNVPLIFWTGYSSLVIVSAFFSSKWTVLISENPMIRVFPRRWLDIEGLRIADFWEAAVRAVTGVIIFRPGITQAELRWRLRSVYDRQEVSEVLHQLRRDGYVIVRSAFVTVWDQAGVPAPLDDVEERGLFLFLAPEKHWYQV